MAIAAATSAAADEQTDITIEASALSPANGSLMRLTAALANDAVISMGAAGWTQIEQIRASAGLDRTLAAFYKFASAGESGTYTVNQDGVSASFVTQISTYTGVDTGTPEDNTAQTSASEAIKTPTGPDFTTQTDRAYAETIIYARGVSLGVPAAPTGYTKFGSNLQANAYMAAAYRDIIGIGLEQPGTWNSFSVSSDVIMITWAMRAATSGGNISQLQGSNLGADLFDGTII